MTRHVITLLITFLLPPLLSPSLVDSWLCGGFAHTRGTVIILSQRYINRLKENWPKGPKMDQQSRLKILSGFGALMVHEQMHSLQRAYPEKFRKLSTDFWGFHRAYVEPDDFIRLNQVSNPDAPNPEWLIPHPTKENSYNWVRTLLKENIELPKMGRDFTDQVFTVVKKDSKYITVKDHHGKPVSFPVSEFDRYLNSFPVVRGIDHPNEISAYMFSALFKAKLTGKTPFENVKPTAKKNSNLFLKWIKSEMSE